MGSKEMFLTHWTLGFDPDMEIYVAPEWAKPPYLPIIVWDESFLKDIRNKQGHFIDWAQPKGGYYSCARMCVEIDLEKGLLKQWKNLWGAKETM